MPKANHPHFTISAPSAVIPPTVENIAEFNARVVTGWMEINREWIAFLARRLQENTALVHSLATCSNPQGVYSVYAAFCQKALADYQCEFTELMQLGQKPLAETAAAARKTMETAARQTVRSAA